MSEQLTLNARQYNACIVVSLLDHIFNGYVENWNLKNGVQVESDRVWGNLAGLMGEGIVTIRPVGWGDNEQIQIYGTSFLAGSWKVQGGIIQNVRMFGVVELPFEVDETNTFRSSDPRWRCVPHRPGFPKRSKQQAVTS